jgi:NAD+ kinase
MRHNAAMKRTFRTVGIFGKYQDQSVGAAVRQLGMFLSQRGLTVLTDELTARSLPEPVGQSLPVQELGKKIDMAVVIGGDGTLLHVARNLADFDVPIIGINQGRLGFLTDIPVATMERDVARILDGQSEIEPRLLLHAEVLRAGKVVQAGPAFNDIILSKGESGRLIEYETYIGGEFVNSARGDGIIVASPTGSTAYAMSSGGPILQPTLEALALVPICPHTLSNRPIVVSADSVIELVLLGPTNGRPQVTFDGQSNVALEDGDRVKVRRDKRRVQLLHPAGRNHYDTLREKLHWGTKY